jgi:anti-sigma factor RsiW
MTGTSHVSEELPSLLSGEASTRVVAAVAKHLRDCDDCRHDLADALLAHASLAATARTSRHNGVPTHDLTN